MTDTRVIDQSALERLAEWGGSRLLRQMVRLFLENSPERMTQIRAGFDDAELRAVERGAHSLKSSAANVGAMAVSRIAQAMEDAAGAGDLEAARGLHASLVTAHELACERLREVEKGVTE